METVKDLCFWVIIASGCACALGGVLMLVIWGVGRAFRSCMPQPVVVTPSTKSVTASASLRRAKPIAPEISVVPTSAGAKDETPAVNNVNCGCGQKLTTPTRTEVGPHGPVLVFNCPSCGEVGVPLNQG